jgi:DNA invertase Pin-like site-specific DNA recombinase
MTTRAAIYLRESDPKHAKDDRYGIPVQLDHALAYCREHGYEPIDPPYMDPGEDSAELNRPGLNRLRADMKAGKIDVIVIDRYDRMARQGWLSKFLFGEAKLHDVAIEFTEPSQQFDLDTPEGQLMADITAYVAEQHRQSIIRSTQNARRKRASEGKMIPSRYTPYGYKWADDLKTMVRPNDETAPIVRRLYAETLAGHSPSQIVADLTTERVPLPSGTLGQWEPANIVRLLRRTHYKGEYVVYRYQYTKERRVKADGTVFHPRVAHLRKEADPNRRVIPIPALVSIEEWDMVQAIIDQRKQGATRNNQTPEATLLRGGVVVCGYCGRPMNVVKRTRKNGNVAWYYVCQNRALEKSRCPERPCISACELDEAAWKRFTTFIINPDTLGQMYDEVVAAERARLPQDDRESEHLRAHLASIEKRIERYTDRLGEEDDPDIVAMLRRRLKETLADREATQHLQEEANYRRQRREELFTDRQRQVRFVQAAWDRLQQGPDSTPLRRSLFAAFDARVVVWKDGHEPRWVWLLWVDTLIDALLSGTETDFKVLASRAVTDPAVLQQMLLDLKPVLARGISYRARRSQRKLGFLSEYDKERGEVLTMNPDGGNDVIVNQSAGWLMY